MPIPIISRVTWLIKEIGTGNVADVTGVTTRAVSYWQTGERTPTLEHQSILERFYESTQYSLMRDRGLSVEAASKYRGLYPDTYDIWTSRLEDIETKFTGGHVLSTLQRQGLSIADLSEQEYADIWSDEYDKLLDEIDESGDDIEQLEGSP